MTFYFRRRYLTTLLSIDLYCVLEFWNSPTLVKAPRTRFGGGLALLPQVGRYASWLSSGSKSRSRAAGIICLSIEGATERLHPS